MGGLVSSLFFQFPWALAALAAIPFLIAAYRRQDTRERRPVSSTMFLKLLRRAPRREKKIRVPLRFLIEVFVLSLLAFALAAPFWADQNDKVALVFDTSLSMQTRTSVDAGARTRFEEARGAARTWIASHSSESEYGVFSAGSQLHQEGREFVRRDEAIGAIERLEPGFTPDRLGPEVGEILERGAFQRVVVFTDKDLDTAGLKAGALPVQVIRVGRPVPNVSLTGLRVEETGTAVVTSRVVASVFAGTGKPLSPTLKVEVLGGSGGLIERQCRGGIEAGAIGEIACDLPSLLPPDTVVRATLLAKDDNALSADDVAWAVARTSSARTLLLVSPDPARGTMGLSQIPGYQVKVVSPEQYAALSNAELEKFTAIIFYKTAPQGVAPAPFLVIVPPPGNRLFPEAKEQRNPVITSWANDHPITTYLRIPALEIAGSVIIDTPSWAKPVISSEQGALVAAGEVQGIRAAGVGFELLPFEGFRTPAPTVLLLNALTWVTRSSSFGDTLLTGANLEVPAGQSWQVSSPSRAKEKKAAGERLNLDLPGTYDIGEQRADGTTFNRVVVANAFHGTESDTLTLGTFSLPLEKDDMKDALGRHGTPLWHLALLFVTGILLLDVAAAALLPRRVAP